MARLLAGGFFWWRCFSACETLELDSSCDSAGGGEPYMPLDGTWQGKWVVNETLQLEEVERVEVQGTFKGDWAYHIGNYFRPDTIRGDFHGDYCWPDIGFSFALVYIRFLGSLPPRIAVIDADQELPGIAKSLQG